MAGHRGQPTKLTQAVCDKIVEGIKLGVPMKYAAQRAGVAERTLGLWLQDARNGANGLKATLLASIKAAQGDFIAANLTRIDEAAQNKNWQAAAWLLERLYPDFFSANRHELKQIKENLSKMLKISGNTSH